MFNVEFAKSAKKEFEALPKRIQDRILEVLKVLSNNPYTDILNIKKIRGEEGLYRVRVGDYRVVYVLQNKVLKILIIKIGYRKDVYR